MLTCLRIQETSPFADDGLLFYRSCIKMCSRSINHRCAADDIPVYTVDSSFCLYMMTFLFLDLLLTWLPSHTSSCISMLLKKNRQHNLHSLKLYEECDRILEQIFVSVHYIMFFYFGFFRPRSDAIFNVHTIQYPGN